MKSHGHQHDEAVVVEEGKKKNKSLLRARNPHRVGDKVLAEFITELGRDSTTVPEFDAKLKEKGDDFPDYFVRALLTILQPIASNPSSATVAEGPAGAESAKFPGLARPDDPDHARNLRLELERDADAAPPAPMRDDRDRRWDGRVLFSSPYLRDRHRAAQMRLFDFFRARPDLQTPVELPTAAHRDLCYRQLRALVREAGVRPLTLMATDPAEYFAVMKAAGGADISLGVKLGVQYRSVLAGSRASVIY
jgi:hypothetical protein